MPISIALLEFFVDNVKIDKHIQGTIPELEKGQFSVAFKFLNFPPFVVNQDGPQGSVPMFKTGKSGLFSIPDMYPIPPDLIRIDIDVSLTMPPFCECGDSVPVGQTSVNITQDFSVIIAEAKAFPDKIPVTRILRDSFLIANSSNKVVGVVSVFVRASCFGDMIVQQFTRAPSPPECTGPCAKTEDRFGAPVQLPCDPSPPPCGFDQPPCVPAPSSGVLAPVPSAPLPPCAIQPVDSRPKSGGAEGWPGQGPCNSGGGGAGGLPPAAAASAMALPQGLLESLKEGIAKGLDPNIPGYLGVSSDEHPATRPLTRETARSGRSRVTGASDVCPCVDDVVDDSGGRWDLPCAGTCGFKYDEIGAEMNGSYLTIRVPRTEKATKETRLVQGLAAKYGYLAPNPTPCVCKSTEVCTCGARETRPLGGGAIWRGEGVGKGPWTALRYGGLEEFRLCPPRHESPKPPKRDPDYENDVLVLKISSKRDGEPPDPPKRPKLELLLRTPKRPEESNKQCTETQYDTADFPPAPPPPSAGKKGKGKKGKGKKGKKGKKK